MGNKAGKRSAGRSGGRRRTSGNHGSKPRQGNTDKTLVAKKRRVLLGLTIEGRGAGEPIVSDDEEVGRNDPCPCGSGLTLESCCGRYLSGGETAPTAEALMRARYSAFATGAIDYLEQTLLPETRGDFDRAHVTDWARGSRWLGLEVRSVAAGGPDDDEGTVEFAAHFHFRHLALQALAFLLDAVVHRTADAA